MPDAQEFTQLLEPNLLPLNRFVMGMVGNSFDAEDIVQETVAKAFIHFDGFRAESKFKTWLMSIAVNEVRSKRRKDFRSRVSYLDTEQLALLPAGASSDTPLREYEQNETTRTVRKAIVSLHPAYEEMIRLRAMDGLNIADAAQHLSISVAAAKARYHRAIQRLSRTLRRQTQKPLRRAGHVARNVVQ
ncbi:MAG TPA: RNA polymerase sigma factor [Bryobacteraceae bacterium]|nr:RNA polymerase sigma factor [Bryobacteraceae bacterium]